MKILIELKQNQQNILEKMVIFLKIKSFKFKQAFTY